MSKRFLFVGFIICILVSGCVKKPKPSEAYEKFRQSAPRSILIVPVVNRSAEITAPDYFLSTVSIPVAEKGYYVFPVNMIKGLLENDGLSDADLVHSASAEKLCSLFGADCVLYISIEQWQAEYIVLTTTVTVALNYLMRDGKTGDVIWEDYEKIVYQPNSNSGGSPLAGLIVMAVQAAITKASPNYMPLAKQANDRALMYPGDGFPNGPYFKKPATKKKKKL